MARRGANARETTIGAWSYASAARAIPEVERSSARGLRYRGRVASISGWLTAAIILIAGAIPLAVRIKRKKRAAPTSRPIRLHVTLGLSVAAFSGIHTLASLLDLGSSDVVAAGDLALALGAAAFLVLLAHTGLGFQLRNPKLRNRRAIRRQHWITATLLVVAVAAHAWLLATAG